MSHRQKFRRNNTLREKNKKKLRKKLEISKKNSIFEIVRNTKKKSQKFIEN